MVAKLAVWLCGQVEDDLAEQILQRLSDIEMSDTSIWRRKEVWGEKMRAQEAEETLAARALPRHGAVVRGQERSRPRMGVAVDGFMVHVRDEGWKEVKGGCVFDVELRTGTEPHEEQAHAVNNSYVAVLGGPRPFGDRLWAEASRRELPRALDSIVLGDGAAWIWRLTGEHFGSSVQAVDWYHAKSHLCRAANLAFGEGSAEARRWVRRQETTLYEGQVWRVVEGIRGLARQHRSVAQELRTEAAYFQKHQGRMQYMTLREDGWPIGSGMIESGAKQYGARLTGPGMRWKRDGLERMLPIRSAILSRRFDEAWENAHALP